MTKKKIAGTKNVYELAQERLKVIFNEFDNIYVSFSGGKDSGVLLNMCIDYIRKNNLKVRLGVFHMDYEIQYKMTIDYVDRMLEANKDILDVYRVCIPFRYLHLDVSIFLASVGRQQKEYMGSFHAEKGNDQRRFSFL